MRKLPYLSAFFILNYVCGIQNIYSQNTFQKTYGGSGSDIAYSVQQTSDGGYIILGETYNFGSGSADIYLN